MFKTNYILILFLIFFAGCSSLSFGGGSGSQGASEEIIGDGLSFSFDIEDDYLPTLTYEISFENNGKEIVEIESSKFYIRANGKAEGSGILDSTSVSNFISDVVGSSNLDLMALEKKNVKGTLVIDEDYYVDLTNEGFDLEVGATYKYKTDFYGGIEVDLIDSTLDLEKIIQAAPVKVVDVDLIRMSDGFKILFFVKDVGSSYLDNENGVELTDNEFKLGTSELDCDPYNMQDGSPVRIETDVILNSNMREVVFACSFDEGKFEDGAVFTQIAGELTYDYFISEKVRVNFPSKRSTGFE